MPSISSRIMYYIAWAFKSTIGMDTTVNVLKKAHLTKKPVSLPSFIINTFKVTCTEVDGHLAYTLSHRTTPDDHHQAIEILYIHGGAYIIGIQRGHWALIAKLLKSLPNATITVPLYPLAVQKNHRDGFAMMHRVYQGMLSRQPSAKRFLMGDSAGGGFALAFSQELRDQTLPQADALLLVSPWLDLTLVNPAIPAIEPVDPLISRAITHAGHLWAAGTPLTDPRLSPLYGDFSHLPPIYAWIGTLDILWPDCLLMGQKAKDQNTYCQLFEYPEMIHIWPLLPMAESKTALSEMLTVIKSVAHS